MKIAPLIGFPGRVLTGTTLKENLTCAETQIRTLAEIERTFNPDIVFYFMDLSVEAESLGLKINFPDEQPPTVAESPVENDDDLNRLIQADCSHGRMQLFIDVVRGYKSNSTKELGAYAIGPFTLACLLLSTNRAAVNIIADPEFLHRVMDFTTGLVLQYVRGLESGGADYIIILEPSSVILSPDQFGKFSSPYINKISSGIHVRSILHICGNTTHLFHEMGKLDNVAGVSLDSIVDLREASAATHKVVIGNISPSVVCYGTKDDIAGAIVLLLEKMKGIPDFILSTGCDLPPETPVENIIYFMEFAREYCR